MLKMNPDDNKSVLNIIRYEDYIEIVRADGTKEIIKGDLEHNLIVYRHQMEEYAKKNIPLVLKGIALATLKLYTKRIILLFTTVTGLFLLYNIDIHIIMKIILSLLVLLFDKDMILKYRKIENELYYNLAEVDATQYYLDHKESFLDTDSDEKLYIINIEDIANQKLTFCQLEYYVNANNISEESEPNKEGQTLSKKI